MGHRSDRGAEEFVLARWPDLVRTACLVTGDRSAAVGRTVEVLAAVLDDWAEVIEEGTPAATARRRLVAALDAADEGHERDLRPGVGLPSGPADELTGAMLAAFDALPVAARVTLALRHLEGHDAVGAAFESGLSVARVRAALEAGLPSVLAAYTEAVARLRRGGDAGGPRPTAEAAPDAEASPDGTGLPAPVWHALDVALESRQATVESGADPVALVAAARRSGRRRRALVGTALAVAAALVATLVGVQVRGEPPAAPVAAAPGVTWGDALTWPVRGGLATNPGVRTTVRTRWGSDTRLLYAGVFGGSRFIVGLTPATEGTYRVRTLIGPNGQPRDGVADRGYDIGGVPTAMALIGIPTAATVPVLVLGRPDVTRAETSATVAYAAGGRALRQWRSWRLEDGVGELTLPASVGVDQPVLPGLRVRLTGLDGPAVNQAEPTFQMPVPACGGCTASEWSARTSAAAVSRITAATGLPASAVRARTLAVGPVARVVTGYDDVGEPIVRSGDFACARYDLPDGTTLVSSALRFSDGDPAWPGGGRLTLLPGGARAAVRPCLQITGVDGYGAVHYVCAVPDAAAVRLVETSPTGVSRREPRVPLVGHVGTVSAPAALLPDRVRLVVLDRADGPIRAYAFGDLVRWRDPFDGGSLFDV